MFGGNMNSTFGKLSFGQNAGTAFGAPQQTTPLFGSSGQAPFGINNNFGTTAPFTSNNVFGHSSQSTMFGNTNASKQSNFSFNPQSANLFGQCSPHPSSSFLSSPPKLFGTGFGSTQQQQSGTAIKFAVVTGIDPMQKSCNALLKVKYHSITCMPEYESKSFEELRCEDYTDNRKGSSQTTSSFGTGNFGVSLFGKQDNKPVFGINNNSAQAFNMNMQAGSNSNVFGSTNFNFGSSNASSNAFGSNIFGSSKSTSFTPQFNFYNKTTEPVISTTTSPFTFGSTPNNTAPTSKQPLGGGFSIFNTNNALGAGHTAFTGFGTTNFNASTKPNLSFGNLNTLQTTNAGQSQLALKENSFGNLFNKQPSFAATNTSNIFGMNAVSVPQNIFFSSQTQRQSEGLTYSQNNNLYYLQLTSPYGHQPHLEGLTIMKSTETFYANDPKEIANKLNTHETTLLSSKKLKTFQISDKIDKDKHIMYQEALLYDLHDYFASPCVNMKRLILNNKSQNLEPAVVYRNGVFLDEFAINMPNIFANMPSAFTSYSRNNLSTNDKCIQTLDSDNTTKNDEVFNESFQEDISDETLESQSKEVEIDTCGIICTRREYYTIPPLEEIARYKNEDGSCIVQGFTIGRIGYGNVHFPDSFDVSNINIDAHVHFRFREVCIYIDDKTKPAEGEGLNRRAQVTLDQVFPKKLNQVDQEERDIEKIIEANFISVLKFACARAATTFVDYRPETGSWVFNVKHFSKYGFYEDDYNVNSSEENVEENIAPNIDSVVSSKDVVVDPKMNLHMQMNSLHVSVNDRRKQISLNYMKYVLFESGEEVLFTPIKKPTLNQPGSKQYSKLKNKIIPKKYSIKINFVSLLHSHINVNSVMDVTILKGRSFKVGWCRGYSFAAVNQTQITIYDFASRKSLNQHDPFGDLSSIDIIMNIILQYSECTMEYEQSSGMSIPFFKEKRGTEALSKIAYYLNSIPNVNQYTTYYANILNLCCVLWCKLESDNCSIRKYEFNLWLENTIRAIIIDELEVIESKKAVDEYNLNDVMTYLSIHDVHNATALTMGLKLPQLSLLLSQLNINVRAKYCLQYQVKMWNDACELKYLPENIMKLYLLVCGAAHFKDVNVMDKLDWLRSFGIYFWYIAPGNWQIMDTIKLFQNAITIHQYVPRPTPIYGKSVKYFDIIYYLLITYSNANFVLIDEIFLPETHSDDLNDYRLSWIMLHTLQAASAGKVSDSVINHVTVHYAAQLESLELYKWAIFVSLFIKDYNLRTNQVLGILHRSLPHADTQFEIDVVKDLHVPKTWVYYIKAHLQYDLRQYWSAYKYLAYAQVWNQCHELCIEFIFPRLIINREFATLGIILNDMYKNRQSIYRWETKGAIIHSFLKIWKTYQPDTITRLTMKEAHIQFCTFVNQLKYFTKEDKIQCFILSEISKMTTIIYQQALLNTSCENEEDTNISLRILKSLSIPADYKYPDFF